MRGTGQLRAEEIGAVHQESDFFVGALVDELDPLDLSLAFDSVLVPLDLLSLDLLSLDFASDDFVSALFASLGLESPDLSLLFESPSDDSRFFPEHFIKKKDIIGRVFLRIWPLDRLGIL